MASTIDCMGYATADYWNENTTTFKNMFTAVPNYFDFGVSASELFSMFMMLNADRLMFKQFPVGEPTVTIENACVTYINYVNMYCKMYGYKYKTLLATEKFEYNPIENYSMSETGNDTRTPNLTHTENATFENHGTGSNNSDSVTGVTTYDNTADFINQNKGTDNATSQSDTNGKNTNTVKDTGTEQTTHTLTRSGNIGVTTSQQMLQSERDIADFSVIRMFINDVTNILCLSIY